MGVKLTYNTRMLKKRRRAGRPRGAVGRLDTRGRILDAAALEFAERGFSGANLASIAAAVGIRRPSLLHHFPTKKELYAAVVRGTFSALGETLAGAMSPEGDFPSRLSALVEAFAAFIDEQPAIASIVLREFLDAAGPGHAILEKEVVPVIDGVEMFIKAKGGKHLRKGLPVRAAVLQVASDMLVRAAAGDLREHLWGKGDHARSLTAALFLNS